MFQLILDSDYLLKQKNVDEVMKKIWTPIPLYK